MKQFVNIEAALEKPVYGISRIPSRQLNKQRSTMIVVTTQASLRCRANTKTTATSTRSSTISYYAGCGLKHMNDTAVQLYLSSVFTCRLQ